MKNIPDKINIGFQEGVCPLACKKCFAFSPSAKRKKQMRKMPMDRAKMLIDEISEIDKANRPDIQPYIFAEPFANKDLKELILYSFSKDVKMTFLTNGILFTDEWIDFFVSKLSNPTTISFSLDAVTQETFEKVRGNYSLERIEKQIMRILQKRKSNDLRIGVSFTIEDDNVQEVDSFFDKWKFVADAVRFSLCVDENKTIIDHFNLPFEFTKNEPEKGCAFISEVMYIDSGGEVRACGWDAFGDSYLGNVFDEGILNVWNGPAMNSLRERIRDGRLTKNDFCYGCHSLSHHGDYHRYEEADFVIVKNSGMIYFNHK